MTAKGMTDATKTRLAVIDLRLRIERLATGAVTNAFPGRSVVVPQTNISNRLAFIFVANGTQATPSELLGLIRLSRHIYRRTSDVLHGRSSMVNLPAVLLAEWEASVARLEAIVRAAHPVSTWSGPR